MRLTNSKRSLAALAASAALALLASPVRGEPADQARAGVADEVGGKRLELRSVEDTISASAEQREKLQREVEAVRTDRAKLNAALILIPLILRALMIA